MLKILRVRIHNINSLAGSWEINFSDEVFTSGLFLVHGPTGVGKTAIFDAICLGLFGQTPRCGVVTESSNDLLHSGENECSAAVLFQTEKGIFESFFYQKVAGKSRKLQQPRLEIFDIEKEILHTGKTVCRAMIKELLGMDYIQFSRSVMLAQGQFASFLAADDKDRGVILERITATPLFGELSVAAHKEKVEIENEIAKIEGELGVFAEREPEIQMMRKLHGNYVRALDSLKNILETFDKEQMQRSVRLSEEYRALRKENFEIGKLLLGKEEVSRLEKVVALEATEAAFKGFCLARESLFALVREKREKTSFVKKNIAELKEVGELLEKIEKELNDRKIFIEKVTEDSEKVKVLKASDCEEALKDMTVKIEKKKKETIEGCELVKKLVQEIIDKEKLYNSTKTAQENEGIFINKMEYLSSYAPMVQEYLRIQEEIRKQLSTYTSEVKVFHYRKKEVSSLKKEISILNEELLQLKTSPEKILALENILERLKKVKTIQEARREKREWLITELENRKAVVLELTQLRMALQLAARNCEISKLEFENSRQQNTISELRSKLVINGNCPVCMNTVRSIPVENFVDLEPLKHKVRISEQELGKAEKALQSVKYGYGLMRSDIRKAIKEVRGGLFDMQRIAHSIEKITSLLGFKKEMENNKKFLTKSLQDKTQKLAELEKILAVCSINEQKQLVIELLSKLKSFVFPEDIIVNSFVATYEKHKKAVEAVKLLEHEIDKLKLEKSLKEKILQEKEAEQALLEKELVTANKKHIEIVSQIQTVMARYPECATMGFDAFVTSISTKYVETVKSREKLAERINSLNIMLTEAQTAISGLYKTMSVHRIQARKVSQQFINHDFKATKALVVSLPSIPEAKTSLQEHIKHLNILAANRSKLTTLVHEKAQYRLPLSSVFTGFFSRKHALTVFTELSEALDFLIYKCNSLSDNLTSYDDLCRKNSDKLALLATKREQLMLIAELDRLIGSANGDKFRIFAQGLTLEKVLESANIILSTMMPRYSLVRAEDEVLGIMVEDALCQEGPRKVKNLSGGETFIVSLSLALGLSNLSGQDIQSLYLDEGFGTLDDDSLYFVLEALKNFQNGNLSVGIISHVPALVSIIETKIAVTSSGQGRSAISGPGCRALCKEDWNVGGRK